VELYDTLRDRGKVDELDNLKALQPKPGQTSFTRQQEPLGLGHAVWCARELVGDEPFALLLPDMVMQGACLSGMVDLYEKVGGNIISVEEVPEEQTHRYGIVGIGEDIGKDGFKITGMVEKPAPGTAPSNLFINGRYILQPEIFSILETQETGAGNEIQITDAMLKLAENQPFSAYHFRGNTFDCGSKEGFIKANVSFALTRSDIRVKVEDDLRRMLDEI
jgi:UTP--glucose-1-phosphate uridylyltransferase